MKILRLSQEDMVQHGKATSCIVQVIHVGVKDIGKEAAEIISILNDTSWIKQLDVATAAAYDQRAKITIQHLVSNILSAVESEITTDFGEYLVSASAQRALAEGCKHVVAPLAELWKEKLTGNPGFDFHSACDEHLITFGEAKYSGKLNPYPVAFQQIKTFVGNKKDVAELSDLKNFFHENCVTNHLDGSKAFAAAFFVNSKNPATIFNNALKSEGIDELLEFKKLYLIGVSLDDQ